MDVMYDNFSNLLNECAKNVKKNSKRKFEEENCSLNQENVRILLKEELRVKISLTKVTQTCNWTKNQFLNVVK